MNGLTLTQPWAQAVVRGVKEYETRSWSIRVPKDGVWFAVHAAKGWTLADREFAFEDAYRFLELFPEDYPRACIVGVAKLVAVLPADQVEVSDQERLFGWFDAGRFAWKLEGARELPKPIACRGAQGWWSVPGDVVAEMRRQLGLVTA